LVRRRLPVSLAIASPNAGTVSLDHLVGNDLQGEGTVSPSILAVFKSITNSNFVGCSTGKSASVGLVGFTSTPIGAVPGTNWCNISNCFETREFAKKLTPVRLPPGRLKLSTSLNSTGSPPVTKTIGMNELRGALGNPVRFILTAGQVNDICQAEGLIRGPSFENLLADMGFDSDRFRASIADLGA
jgi:hypothetical protein